MSETPTPVFDDPLTEQIADETIKGPSGPPTVAPAPQPEHEHDAEPSADFGGLTNEDVLARAQLAGFGA